MLRDIFMVYLEHLLPLPLFDLSMFLYNIDFSNWKILITLYKHTKKIKTVALEVFKM